MNFFQWIASLFGRQYILVAGSYGSFEVRPVHTIKKMCYVVENGSMKALQKDKMAGSIQEFFRTIQKEAYNNVQTKTWFPLSDRMLATYQMISQGDEK